MGTPLKPNEPGDACFDCWGEGKPFGEGPTPKTVIVTLSDFQPAKFWDQSFDQTLLTPHLLEQSFDACSYEIDDAGFNWFLWWKPTETLLVVQHVNLASNAFFHRDPPICDTLLPDQGTTPQFRVAIGGFANITWDREGLE